MNATSSILSELAISAVLLAIVFPLVAAYLVFGLLAGAVGVLADAWRVDQSEELREVEK